MDNVIGQRVLGGVVLVAAAILFLPLVLEGAGVAALQPPEIPAKPVTPTAGDLAPALQGQAAELEQAIAESHGEPTFYPVQPTTQTVPETTEDVPERFRLAEETKPVAKPVVKKPEPSTPAPEKPAPVASALKSENKPAPKTDSKPVAKAEPKSASPAEPKAAAKPAQSVSSSPGLPSAYVVQVASLSSQASADELVSRLRKRGFRASAVAQGNTVKVSVGPELDRSIAESLRQRLSADPELKLNGFIVPYRP